MAFRDGHGRVQMAMVQMPGAIRAEQDWYGWLIHARFGIIGQPFKLRLYELHRPANENEETTA